MTKADQQESFGTHELVNHMVCYDLIQTDVRPFVTLPLKLQDQLSPEPLNVQIGFDEQFLCAPAYKSFEEVGGFDVSINTSALLLAGVQSVSMWMIPVVIAGIGIGIFVIKRRN